MPNQYTQPRDPAERFWSRVDKDGPTQPHMDTPCWVWTARKDHSGYGWIWFNGADERSHRVAWLLAHGAIPAGLGVLHECDNPACVRLDQLRIGTQADNVSDMLKRGRHRSNALRGTDAPGAKLTEEQVREIMTSDGSKTDIAARFGVSRRAVQFILNGRNWKHVTAVLS